MLTLKENLARKAWKECVDVLLFCVHCAVKLLFPAVCVWTFYTGLLYKVGWAL